ncbi:maleylacetoacetate isomerase [Pseudoduganella albidiflava]|uniref:Maleylacetoacetate isomerase n=1 Tax=Pseudoduganella albidiflava TaxID=321983 RepID=A0A411WUT6_9BURK|nr:maleylacetoacetate isomerase [Pseudoduganella albidiflava]QBI00520.1 maleylacetoacetate isomerase [Pseudoduganella albidiflava]GGY32659.1 maleylacetoacetate isomerase [Pseudoduganella albidiflava]
MKLYTYFRSSAAYRVRIALNLKGVAYDAVPVHLLKDGGEQHGAAYRAVNPSELIPALETDGATLAQSLAIIEYLEEVHPVMPLLPQDALGRARVRALAQTIASDTHPLTNLRVLRHLKGTLGLSEDDKNAWYRHWLGEGMRVLEAQLASSPATGRFCHGDMPTIADCCLVPQVFNARRVGIDLAPFPTITAIDAACAGIPAFQAAHPSQQPDAE